MAAADEMRDYAAATQKIAEQFVKDLCKIPAPSNHEEKRAEFMKKWFEENGGTRVYIDSQLNVICPYNVKEDNEIVVMMAHLDTVFPDTDPMPFKEEEGKFLCPGVTDDTGNLASLAFAARYVLLNRIPVKYGILFVANSGEEGLGNLKGSKKIVEEFGDRIRHFITVDGTDHRKVVNRAVGSHRYNVTVKTEGGHSYSSFGNKNAIACLSSLISDLYAIEVPKNGDSRTTYNVGTIQGGTSVNTIAQEASMLFEYRSDDVQCLAVMEKLFFEKVGELKDSGVSVQVEKIGDRPCGKIAADNPVNSELISIVSDAVLKTTGGEVTFKSGSTDANSALAEGIPALCVSGAVGGLCHTREEWLLKDSLQTGIILLLEIISNYME